MKLKGSGQTSVALTVILAFFSGFVGALITPFFQQKLVNEQIKVERINDVLSNLQKAHLEMTLYGWRLTIAEKATQKEINAIHDSWLFAHRSVSKWLEFSESYLESSQPISAYRTSIKKFYDLETGTSGFGLAHKENQEKGQRLIAEVDANFSSLRLALIRAGRVSLF